MNKGYLFFPTSLGRAGLAWNDRGLTAVELPDAEQGKKAHDRLRAAAGRETPSDAPKLPWIKDAIARLTRYFDGHDEDLSGIPLDYSSAPPFHRKVYDVACRIGRGQVLTYGDIAEQAGSPGASRAVGQALAKNPLPILVPCHRVLASGGKPGGFSAPGGLTTKARLLALEGVQIASCDKLPGSATIPAWARRAAKSDRGGGSGLRSPSRRQPRRSARST